MSTIYLTSASPIKIKATYNAFKSLGLSVNVLSVKTKSGVSEQPLSIEETLQGALNRIVDLENKLTNATHKAILSIEGGNAKLLKNEADYHHVVAIVFKTPKRITKNIFAPGLCIPGKIIKQIPTKYKDLGEYVQQNYGIKDKDPYVAFTNGKLTRENILQWCIKTAILLNDLIDTFRN